jgi:hypothetical protein
VLEALAAAAVVLSWVWIGRRAGWNGPPAVDVPTRFWPFYLSTWDTRTVWTWRALLPLAALAAALVPLRRWLGGEGDGRRALVALGSSAYLVHLGLGIQRYGVEEGLRHSFERGFEYLADARLVGPGFLARYPEGVGPLSLHGATHPPGPILVLAAARRAGLTGVHGAEFLVSFAAVLAGLFLYGAARRLADEDVARCTLALFLFAGSVSAFAVASMDTVTMLLAALACYGFALALTGSVAGGALWGAALAAATLFNFLAAALTLTYAALLVARRAALDRRRLTALAAGPATFFAAYALLALGWGYRPLHTFLWCWQRFTVSPGAGGSAVVSLLGNPVAFLGSLGLVLGGLAGRAVAGALRRAWRREDPVTTSLVLAAALPVAVCMALRIPRAEVEHVYLLFVPAVVLGAAAAARRWYGRSEDWFSRFAVPSLVVQSVLVEVYVDTYW